MHELKLTQNEWTQEESKYEVSCKNCILGYSSAMYSYMPYRYILKAIAALRLLHCPP